jgi:hypothetical protein
VRPNVALFRRAGAFGFGVLVLMACGESRRPIGDECLRSDDCLSGVCALRTCVAAPKLINGAGDMPPDDAVQLAPPVDAGATRNDGG